MLAGSGRLRHFDHAAYLHIVLKACYDMQEPFVDFIRSDLQARAMLIKAAFDLFTIMQKRNIQVKTQTHHCRVLSVA